MKTEIKIIPILQQILDSIEYESLPLEWSTFDVVEFSKNKKLWRFQQDALKNAIKLLYLYFKKYNGDKKKFYEIYLHNNPNPEIRLDDILDINIRKIKKNIINIIENYYNIENYRIKFYNLINRAGFWMATGSGKTLIIVKLVEILEKLMDLGEIPRRDILILTYRDDLIEQLKKHVREFNELSVEREFKINLEKLTNYDRIKKESLIPYTREATVFYYRSDLINDKQKEKQVDFRNYDNNGKWYIILDEAHKGDKEESKRQMFYSIMSRNGFLFNFSATFTDERDIITTAYNFNLERFISEGYGKHIYILRQEARAFRENEDYTSVEKQKVVLKSLILLTYIKKIREKIKKKSGTNMYHEPLLLTLVNTVNMTSIKREKPDLILFFKEIENIGKGNIDRVTFDSAKEELIEELTSNPRPLFEDYELHLNHPLIYNITINDILKYIYNSDSFGTIEAILIPGTKKEALFKLKTSNKPFALIRIDNTIKFIKNNLKGYEVIESYENKSIFENLNEREDISILMGSRSFYEGWDSNRPNIILFINIGIREDAKKFITQSIGRGVRIEPLKNKKRRIKILYNNREDNGIYPRIREYADAIETLFVFGTSRKTLEDVMKTLKVESKLMETIELEKNKEAEDRVLLIPIFKITNKRVYEERDPQKFTIPASLFDAVKEYFLLDDRVLLVNNELSPKLLLFIRKTFNNYNKYYIIKSNTNRTIPFHILIKHLINHFNLKIEELNSFKQLDNEIIHFKNIKVFLNDMKEVKQFKYKIDKIIKYYYNYMNIVDFLGKLEKREYEEEKFKDFISAIAKGSSEERFRDLRIKYIQSHYYIPVILSYKERINYIKHIIRTKSEVEFIEDLEYYISNNNIRVDWWMFSKIDEHFDNVYIPYYDPEINRMRKFKPDFIFWFGRGENYLIVFVDPKGTKHTSYEYKVDWFEKFFGEIDTPKQFKYNNYNIKVLLLLYTRDKNKPPDKYAKYWIDNVEELFAIIQKHL